MHADLTFIQHLISLLFLLLSHCVISKARSAINLSAYIYSKQTDSLFVTAPDIWGVAFVQMFFIF